MIHMIQERFEQADKPVDFWSLRLSDGDFRRISGLVHDLTGMNLHEGKEDLIRSRLLKRLRFLKLRSFGDYVRFIESDRSGCELIHMIDSLTTNKTQFFREVEHFDYLRCQVLPRLENRRLRIWSAGCSSGEEPYTIGMVLSDEIRDAASWNVKILATDISTRVLRQARFARYSEDSVRGLPLAVIGRYFRRVDSDAGIFEVVPEVQALVTIARLNLMDDWPMTGAFDAVFCRNVMIYFRKEDQQTLVNRFWEMIAPGGHLFVGHSESLSALSHRFRYIQPAVYRKGE